MSSSSFAVNLPGQNILEVVRLTMPHFRKSELKVADRVLENPQSILNATLAEAAVIANVSEPTVIRFCTADRWFCF